ncbi:hypothetical protein [Phocoenobacter skyensis]|uniref:Lipoprotein n=1 Tax=Phocoenobacter skyensis TaxID=97481 RepID=A0AAJ6P215_9PAST|nr:hypothetical protein [Pasteurella skyensis]MDP8079165.1 hypothetical protein [Pasteurella skyensis]MDP8085115.1 hypothetical protein [Pasteurella skyensis]MDP8170102.1 hypothetical protein [Pasteurella skyensis]MDP8174284.1 hypothetical protein [Pasteurella skyensis]
MKKILLVILGISLSINSFARSCDSSEYDKAEYFASSYGKKLANKYPLAKDIRTTLSSCSYNSYSERFKTKVEIYWTGGFSGDSYNIDGDLIFDSDGTNGHFSSSYKNQNVKDLESWGKFIGVVGGAIVLGAASSQ